MIKACAEHALTTCLRAYESTKAQGPMCFSCWGTGSGDGRGRGSEKRVPDTAQKRFIQNHDCFIGPLVFQGWKRRQGEWTLLCRTKLHGKPQSEARLVTAITSRYSICS